MQTQDQIVAEIKRVGESREDFFGVWQSGLASGLDYQHVTDLQMIGETITEEQWESAGRFKTDDDVRDAAKHYLEFAAGKATDHRGLSANRSVDHYRAWVWLVGGDEALAQLEAASYPKYGVPQLLEASDLLNIQDEWARLVVEHPELTRMARGEACRPGCDEGCGA